MKKTALLPLLILCLAGCSTPTGQPSRVTPDAVRCDQNWKRQGFDFDPNCMTCSQMWDSVQARRRAAYWRTKGYVVDANSLAWQQIDQKVRDFDRARYWKERGHEFDPNAITAQEMDKSVQRIKEVQYWKDLGYYYDPVSRTVYLNKDKQTPLRSLPAPTATAYWSSYGNSSWSSLGSSSTYSYSPPSTYEIPSARIAENGSYYGQISENTGRPKTTYVGGYFRKDGTYVRSHYRSK
jgi:hypothetical protein